MPNPKLIIVIGLPASGKTTLAKKLSEKFKVPLITKDQLKICLIDKLTKKDER
ncbi:MAG: ATP-binding protein [Bacteriovoracaceae bacterium]|nr:ATP-binding protein [Bacteriovoracaceae bacterium]